MGLAKLLVLISPKKRLEVHMHKIIRRVVRTYSRDPYLSLGRYITRRDAEIKGKRVSKYRLS